MNPNRHGQPTTAAQRVAHAMNNPNEPTACKKCGSIYFMELIAQMYTSGSYGFRAVSTVPMKVYMCPCGEIQAPPGMNSGNVAGGERDLFAQSLQAAVAYQLETGVDALAKGVAGIHELRELQLKVTELQQQVNVLCETQGLEPIVSEPAESSTREPEDDEGLQTARLRTDAEPVTLEEPEALPLVASGNRGRSQAGTTEAKGDVKFVEAPQRAVAAGGARARLRRQGQ